MGATDVAGSALGSYATGGHFSGLAGIHAHGSTIGRLSDGGSIGVPAISRANSISGGIGLVGQSFFGIAVYGYLAGLTAEALTSIIWKRSINHVSLASVNSAGEFSCNVSLWFFD